MRAAQPESRPRASTAAAPSPSRGFFIPLFPSLDPYPTAEASAATGYRASLARVGGALRQDGYRKGVDNASAERSGPPQYQRRNSIRSPRVHVADAARQRVAASGTITAKTMITDGSQLDTRVRTVAEARAAGSTSCRCRAIRREIAATTANGKDHQVDEDISTPISADLQE